MWTTIGKGLLLFIYTPVVIDLAQMAVNNIKIPEVNIQKRIHDVTSYCKCGVCQQNRRLGLPLPH